MNTSRVANVFRVTLLVVFAFGIAVAASGLGFRARLPNPDLKLFGSLLASLLFASAILERALDVWLSIWMGGEADLLDGEIRQLKANIDKSPPETPQQAIATDRQELEMLQVKRTEYQGKTRKRALPIAMGAGLIISAIGLRALDPLFESPEANSQQLIQSHVFSAIDIIVTGTLLAGGSDGIHWIVALYRDWIDNNRSTKG
jgi:hypothetical protein